MDVEAQCAPVNPLRSRGMAAGECGAGVAPKRKAESLRRLDLQDIDGGLELRASSLEYTRARSSAIRRDRNEVRFLYAGPNPF